MSPPCLTTIFEGENGGATGRGVNSTEIRVAVPASSYITNTGSSYRRPLDALFEYFNRRYELYGRRLVPVYVAASPSDPVRARTLAAELAAKNPFAVLTGPGEWDYQPQAALVSALARDGIVTIARAASAWWTDRVIYDSLHPYVWSVYPSSEDLQANLGSFACSGLAGHVAANAGDADLHDDLRRFGLLAVGQDAPPQVRILESALETCTGATVTRVEVTAGTASSTIWQNAFARMRQAQVTTVICACDFANGPSAVSSAHTANFHPEWVLTPSMYATSNDENWMQDNRAANIVAPPMRISAGPRLLPLQARPWFAAAQSIDSGVFTNPGDPYGTYSMPEFLYDQLLVLASGIQGAGPQLNPDTFAAALMATQFGNPGAGQPPYWQSSAGFGPGDHSLYDDYTVAWWSDTAPALDYPISARSTGSWCYLGGGLRFQPGRYPVDADARLSNPAEPCR